MIILLFKGIFEMFVIKILATGSRCQPQITSPAPACGQVLAQLARYFHETFLHSFALNRRDGENVQCWCACSDNDLLIAVLEATDD